MAVYFGVRRTDFWNLANSCQLRCYTATSRRIQKTQRGSQRPNHSFGEGRGARSSGSRMASRTWLAIRNPEILSTPVSEPQSARSW